MAACGHLERLCYVTPSPYDSAVPNRNNSNEHGGSFKELFAAHANGVQTKIEEAVRDEIARLRQELVTKQELNDAVATLQQADDDMVTEHERFVTMTAERFDRFGL